MNAAPHLGHALEYVQTDALARHRRLRGQDLRFLTGTDDNALKNVQAATAAGMEPAAFVATNAEHFKGLRTTLGLCYDDFIQTASDPRHRPGVERLWQRCAQAGDLYQRHYEGLYCVGCEQFYEESELTDGVCPEHKTAPERVSEENWFFRLSRYQDRLLELIESGELRIEPRQRRNEVLGFIQQGLQDFSVSRDAERAHNWGIPVPGDPSQVIYVWFDALGNYITALDYGGDRALYDHWWLGADERIHVIGKGILRFHAVYWPAMLLSAQEPLPSTVAVHDYLTVEGGKISKSLGNVIDPKALVERFGQDALRWWLLRDVPTLGEADFSLARLVERANQDLANGLGNLANRTFSMIHRYRDGAVPEAEWPAQAEALRGVRDGVAAAIDEALARFDFRAATGELWRVVDEANRLVDATKPWELAKAERDGAAPAALDGVLAALFAAVRAVTDELEPFLPELAAKVGEALGDGSRVPKPEPLFPRLELET